MRIVGRSGFNTFENETDIRRTADTTLFGQRAIFAGPCLKAKSEGGITARKS